MNKDLEIKNPNIREYHTILGELIEIENYHPNLTLQLQHIKEAASRMAADIERLKKEVSDVRISCYDHIKETIGLKDYIARLKAELEKRPDVIYCKDCVNRFSEDACAIDKEKHFCSFGQRKSEEGK